MFGQISEVKTLRIVGRHIIGDISKDKSHFVLEDEINYKNPKFHMDIYVSFIRFKMLTNNRDRRNVNQAMNLRNNNLASQPLTYKL